MQLHRERDAISLRGARLVLVGHGALHFARAFVEDLAIQVPVYVDPTLETYRALGMRRSAAAFFSPKALLNLARALRAGFRQTSVQGDALQLGGVLVVRPDGVAVYRHLSSEVGDHPPVAEVLAAL